MKAVLALLALVALTYAQRPTGTGVPPTYSPCQVCHYIVSQAEHHLRRGRVDQGELQIALLQECETLRRFQGQGAVDSCVSLVDNNIATLVTDVNANKSVDDICKDIKQC
ncbi:unnamed protein product, partial [Mesorhabditis spiculigera]